MNEQQIKEISNAFHKLDRLAVTALREGDYDNAIRAYREALEAERALGLELQSARTMVNLASTQMLMGQFREALVWAEDAIGIFERRGSRAERCHSRLIKAQIHVRAKDYLRAETDLNDAARLCGSDDLRGQIAALRFIVYSGQNRRVQSRQAIDQAVRCFELSGNGAALEEALSQRIRFFEQTGQRQAAALDRARLTGLRSREPDLFSL